MPSKSCAGFSAPRAGSDRPACTGPYVTTQSALASASHRYGADVRPSDTLPRHPVRLSGRWLSNQLDWGALRRPRQGRGDTPPSPSNAQRADNQSVRCRVGRRGAALASTLPAIPASGSARHVGPCSGPATSPGNHRSGTAVAGRLLEPVHPRSVCSGIGAAAESIA